jgi:hypothetical protein
MDSGEDGLEGKEMSDEQVDALEEELAASKARIAELEAALRPFANTADYLWDRNKDDMAACYVSDFRQAYKVLREK